MLLNWEDINLPVAAVGQEVHGDIRLSSYKGAHYGVIQILQMEFRENIIYLFPKNGIYSRYIALATMLVVPNFLELNKFLNRLFTLSVPQLLTVSILAKVMFLYNSAADQNSWEKPPTSRIS